MESCDIKREYAVSLAKHSRRGGLYWSSIFGILFSIIGITLSPVFVYMYQSRGCVIVAATLFLFSLTILIYTRRVLKRSHRYAQAVHYFHFVNHVMRDYTAEIIRGGKFRSLDDELSDIVTAIADCFSAVTEQKCRCCIKALEAGTSPQQLFLRTVARDRLSSVYSHGDNMRHKLDENTDFSNLWYAVPPFFRGYVANDLHKLFIQGEYQNTSIKKGYRADVGPFGKVRNWPLPYVSTLVVPIRYISEFLPPKEDAEKVTSHWICWGFLCIDSNHKNVFLDPDLLILAGGFADSIYSFVSNVECHLKKDLFSK